MDSDDETIRTAIVDNNRIAFRHVRLSLFGGTRLQVFEPYNHDLAPPLTHRITTVNMIYIYKHTCLSYLVVL